MANAKIKVVKRMLPTRIAVHVAIMMGAEPPPMLAVVVDGVQRRPMAIPLKAALNAGLLA